MCPTECSMREYEKPSLREVKGKKSWYVVITKPISLRLSKNDKTIRRTTGTSDKRIAGLRMHSIAEEIYKEWDERLKGDPFRELLSEHWSEEKDGSLDDSLDIPDPMQKNEDDANKFKIVACLKACYTTGEFNEVLADKLFQFLNPNEAKMWRQSIQDELSPYPVHIQQQQTNDQLAKEAIEKQKVGDVLNKTGAPKLSEFVDDYSRDKKWDKIRDKTKKDTFNLIRDCINIIGDLPVDQVYRQHATMIAKTLDEDGLSNSRIKTWVGSIRGLLEYVVATKLNTIKSPPEPWITSNSFFGFKAQAYGSSTRSFEALKEDQLHALFDLDMPEDDRLLLNILITTGMRLDEVALLEWEQYKVDRNGLRYFDLGSGSIIKNDKFSARDVAIPDCLKLPKPSVGALFNFSKDSDGKSSKAASRHLNEKYIQKIRYNEEDDRKVIHSLRHNLSGFLLNLKPTPSSEIMDWITGHGMQGDKTQSERQRTYSQDPDVLLKYELVNQIKHPWLK